LQGFLFLIQKKIRRLQHQYSNTFFVSRREHRGHRVFFVIQ
jgi:hypothetical protein